MGSSAALESDAQRIAAALEANNRRQEPAYAKQDADKSAMAAQSAAFWALMLFIAGVAETVVTGVGVYLVYRTLKEAKRSADEARRAADEMRRSADAAVLAADLARHEFISSHRPHIFVHAVDYISVPTGDGDGRSSIGASLLCFNDGATRAKKVDARGDIIVDWKPEVDVQRGVIGTFEDVRGGTKLRFAVVSERTLGDIPENGPLILCVGTIAYWDDSDVRRETGFCLRLRRDHKPSWTSANSAEHEYDY
jgi:hypothetical protein